MNNKKIIISTFLFAVGLIATIATKHTFISIIGIVVAVVGLWMLRKAVVERRKNEASKHYQRLDTDSAETDKTTVTVNSDIHNTTGQKTDSAEASNDIPKNEPKDPEMETVYKNAMLTLIKYVMEVDSMARMGMSEDPQKVSVDDQYLIFYRKAKDRGTMDTVKMMPEMMANLAMMEMVRHENVHDVVDAAYFTGKSVKTIWVDDNGAQAEMVFSHVSFDRIFAETNHTPDKTRFLTSPKNIFG